MEPTAPQIKNPLVLIMSVLLIIAVAAAGFFYFQTQKLSKELLKYQFQPFPSLSITSIPSESPKNRVSCTDPRPEICTMECAQSPPYICGSDGKSYCSVCQACSNKDVAWYEIKTSVCQEEQFCGGISGKVCPDGYSCKYDGNYPDASGVCIKSTEKTPAISDSELSMGWYYGTEDQKKPNTPVNWIYTEAGRSSCWHKSDTQCGYLPD